MALEDRGEGGDLVVGGGAWGSEAADEAQRRGRISAGRVKELQIIRARGGDGRGAERWRAVIRRAMGAEQAAKGGGVTRTRCWGRESGG